MHFVIAVLLYHEFDFSFHHFTGVVTHVHNVRIIVDESKVQEMLIIHHGIRRIISDRA